MKFNNKFTTKIWKEIPSDQNPYVPKATRLYGYDTFELLKKKSFIDVIFLLMLGDLPTKHQTFLLEKLMIFLLNPGPRDVACRAGMTAGISKSLSTNLLPIGLMAAGGKVGGGAEVEEAMQFLIKHHNECPEKTSDHYLNQVEENEGQTRIAPGFGKYYGSLDILAMRFAELLMANNPTQDGYIKWAHHFVEQSSEYDYGWLKTGISAAVFLDLNIRPREGSGLYQLLVAPGILAHAMEQTHHPITAMPFVSDEDYTIE